VSGNKPLRVLIIVACILAGFLFGYGVAFVWGWLRDNKIANFNADYELFVYPEDNASDIAKRISSEADVKWPSHFEHLFKKHGVDSLMKPGHYVIKSGSRSIYVVRMLNNGWQTPVNLIFSGTMRRPQDIAKRISRQMMLDSLSVLEALSDEDLLSKFEVTPATVFSLIIPDTYQMYWTAGMEDILSKLKIASDNFWTQSNIKKAKDLNLTPLQVSILASIVNSETNYVPEMPSVAGVYLNRLAIGMKLQADPTVAFCYDFKVRRIYRKMLSFDSPYNTYRYAGLPPAPICVPSKDALNAVLNAYYGEGFTSPTGKGNIYFCADPSFNGRHRFSHSFSEHKKNARAFTRALSKK